MPLTGNGLFSFEHGPGILAFVVLAMSALIVAIMAITAPSTAAASGATCSFCLVGWSGHGFSTGVLEGARFAAWSGLSAGAAGFRGLVFVARPEWAALDSALRVNDAPAFTWKHFLLAGPVTVLAFGIFAAGCVAVGFSAQVESLTAGYVRVRPDGIYLIERTFQSGDREVRLAGMMHIARREFYSGLLPPADPAVPSVVLVEGVTDRKRLLGDAPSITGDWRSF